MSDSTLRLPARPSLDQLRKQAKELLRDYRAGNAAAAERLSAIIPRLADPAQSGGVTLAEAQFVLAREYGFESWAKLVHHVKTINLSDRLERYEKLAMDLVTAYGGDAEALERLNDLFPRSLTLDQLQELIQQRMEALSGSAGGTADFAVADAQLLVARQHGFESWARFVESFAQPPSDPRLRMLMCQDTKAGDDGFEALSRSQTIEYIWGRKCYGLTGRGFASLAAMPSLRGLAVSCKNLDDTALSALPRFPALRGLMPMDVSDDGFRHVGRCEPLEDLWCMYCRDTSDAATEHIAGLSRLKTYYAGATQITDRSLEILGRMSSLENIEFWECAGITNTGIALLAGLPRLSEISVGGSPNVTREGMAVFPATVRANYW